MTSTFDIRHSIFPNDILDFDIRHSVFFCHLSSLVENIFEDIRHEISETKLRGVIHFYRDPFGRGSEPARGGSEPARRASEPAEMALKLGRRA